jgi:hypothetical protein
MVLSSGIVASVLSLVYRVKLIDTPDPLWWSSIVNLCAYDTLSLTFFSLYAWTEMTDVLSY